MDQIKTRSSIARSRRSSLPGWEPLRTPTVGRSAWEANCTGTIVGTLWGPWLGHLASDSVMEV
jgi:hypothetical protein